MTTLNYFSEEEGDAKKLQLEIYIEQHINYTINRTACSINVTAESFVFSELEK